MFNQSPFKRRDRANRGRGIPPVRPVRDGRRCSLLLGCSQSAADGDPPSEVRDGRRFSTEERHVYRAPGSGDGAIRMTTSDSGKSFTLLFAFQGGSAGQTRVSTAAKDQDAVEHGCQTLARGPTLARSVLVLAQQALENPCWSWPAGITQHM